MARVIALYMLCVVRKFRLPVRRDMLASRRGVPACMRHIQRESEDEEKDDRDTDT